MFISPGSRILCPGSWILGPGSWVLDPGSGDWFFRAGQGSYPGLVGMCRSTVFSHFFGSKKRKPFSANLASTWEPKRLQNQGPKPTKSLLNKTSFSVSILEGLGTCFGRVCGRFFGPEMQDNYKNTILAKTLKIVTLPRENAYFQEIEDENQRKTSP